MFPLHRLGPRLIPRSAVSVSAGVDVVRPSLVIDNPLLDLLEPLIPLIHRVVEGETAFPVVNLLTAEALIASHERLASHVFASTVDWFFVVVVCHDVFSFSYRVWVDPVEWGAFHPFVICVFYQIRYWLSTLVFELLVPDPLDVLFFANVVDHVLGNCRLRDGLGD